jgi:hypothetical protein
MNSCSQPILETFFGKKYPKDMLQLCTKESQIKQRKKLNMPPNLYNNNNNNNNNKKTEGKKNLSKRKDNVAVMSRKRSLGHRPHEVHIKILQQSVTASHGFMLCQGNKIKIHHIK